MKKILLASLCLGLCLACKENPQNTISKKVAQIETAVLQQQELYEVPGLAVGIISADTVTYTVLTEYGK